MCGRIEHAGEDIAAKHIGRQKYAATAASAIGDVDQIGRMRRDKRRQ